MLKNKKEVEEGNSRKMNALQCLVKCGWTTEDAVLIATGVKKINVKMKLNLAADANERRYGKAIEKRKDFVTRFVFEWMGGNFYGQMAAA